MKHPIAKGLALGTAGHALGVAVGIEMGEVEAAMASIAVTVVGVVTVVVIPMFMPFIDRKTYLKNEKSKLFVGQISTDSLLFMLQ